MFIKMVIFLFGSDSVAGIISLAETVHNTPWKIFNELIKIDRTYV